MGGGTVRGEEATARYGLRKGVAQGQILDFIRIFDLRGGGEMGTLFGSLAPDAGSIGLGWDGPICRKHRGECPPDGKEDSVGPESRVPNGLDNEPFRSQVR